MSKNKNHCLICGDTHSGECSPESFNFYQCSNCSEAQRLPFDAAMFGLKGIYCCGTQDNPITAEDTWVPITYDKYIEIEKSKSPE